MGRVVIFIPWQQSAYSYAPAPNISCGVAAGGRGMGRRAKKKACVEMKAIGQVSVRSSNKREAKQVADSSFSPLLRYRILVVKTC